MELHPLHIGNYNKSCTAAIRWWIIYSMALPTELQIFYILGTRINLVLQQSGDGLFILWHCPWSYILPILGTRINRVLQQSGDGLFILWQCPWSYILYIWGSRINRVLQQSGDGLFILWHCPWSYILYILGTRINLYCSNQVMDYLFYGTVHGSTSSTYWELE